MSLALQSPSTELTSVEKAVGQVLSAKYVASDLINNKEFRQRALAKNPFAIAIIVAIVVILGIGAAVYAYKICLDRGGHSISGLSVTKTADGFNFKLGFECNP